MDCDLAAVRAYAAGKPLKFKGLILVRLFSITHTMEAGSTGWVRSWIIPDTRLCESFFLWKIWKIKPQFNHFALRLRWRAKRGNWIDRDMLVSEIGHRRFNLSFQLFYRRLVLFVKICDFMFSLGGYNSLFAG